MMPRIGPENVLRMDPVPDFDPAHVFLCGQCFRWEPLSDGRWRGVAGGLPLMLSMEENILCLEGPDVGLQADHWLRYLDLQAEYGAWKRLLSADDPVMAEATRFGHGLRLLRQDPWETLATFLISQNNGIPRIRQIVRSLCDAFGDPIDDMSPACGQVFTALAPRRTFPSAERLAALSAHDLDVLRAGYRAPYLLTTARQVASGEADLASLAGMPLEEAREALMRLHGVGIKVADCTLLFSGLHREAFPVDRWVLRLMQVLYPGSGLDTVSLQRFAAMRWGPLAGLAQQYLFFYARENRIGV